MNDKRIEIELKNVYGNDLYYPVCDNAKEFAKLLGTKTISPDSFGSIKKLGFAVWHVIVSNQQSVKVGEL